MAESSSPVMYTGVFYAMATILLMSNKTSDKTKTCLLFHQNLSALKNLILNDVRKDKIVCNNYANEFF